MVQQVASQRVSVPPLQGRVAADPDFGLVADLLAAAEYLSPPARTPPVAPAVSVHVELGGVTLDELSEFLPVGSELPLEHPLLRIRLHLHPAAPAQLPGTPRAPAAPSPVASPRAPSLPAESTESGEETDKEEWENDDDTDPYAAANLIRDSLTIAERPPLPSPPERHPSAGWWNHYNPEAPVDMEAAYAVRKLIDRHGEPPHVAYLVEWNCRPCQLSWEWPENLKSVYSCMNQVNKWKADDSDLSFNALYGSNFRGAGALDKNLCFLHAFQAACYGLGRSGLVNRDHWKRFCLQQGKTFADGVLARDIDAFFIFIRAENVLLDYVELFKVYQDKSMLSAVLMEKAVRGSPPGYYIVHAAEDVIEHCFTLIIRGPSDPVMIYDGYHERNDTPVILEPL
ncbi:hypothetical protein PC113_g20939 [Phytophthora cactorum]|uniref:Uncharacterized protein n=1 Tax=Phytophthora cactorum TaxID=29920 RepID=A0A8T0YEY2_9STRA|nr:hypothetical protein PC111_g20502 [Phytophthora cactorum]KAG2831406.1 hypothetical protein PC113_g20939 [Phytophthora cactorum]